MRPSFLLTFCGTAMLVIASARLPAAAPAVLARDGKPALELVLGQDAPGETRAAAEALAAMLGRITGAAFKIGAGNGARGIALGVPADFPELRAGVEFAPADPMRREEYLLRSHPAGLWLLGATPLAVRHAVWDLLHRLGYRQYFPGDNWECVPPTPNLEIAVDALQAPAFASRWMFYQYGSYRNRAMLDAWLERNRGGKGFELHTSHSFPGFISRNKAAFAEHPEYLAMVKGVRVPATNSTSKFCISNPALRQLIVDDALRLFAKEPERDSVSLDPSDGSGWCECAGCAALGGPSNQLATLVNQVAAAVTGKYPGKRLGMYAYHLHSTPPTIDLHPAVIVSIATNLRSDGLTNEQLANAWAAKGVTVGTRDYWSIWTWTRDLPGGARASQPGLLAKSIAQYHSFGSRFMIGESGDNWGACGLGYYIAMRTLWDVSEAERVEEIKDEFLAKAFGPAKEPMRAFYRQLDGDQRLPLSEDMVGRMYRALEEAAPLAVGDPRITRRLDELTLYTRYVELYRAYSAAEEGPARQKAFEEMTAFALRITPTGMVASLAVHRDLPVREKAVKVPAGREYSFKREVREANPWMKWAPFSASELAGIRKNGIAANQIFDMERLQFSEDLVPATPLVAQPMETGSYKVHPRYTQKLYVWIPAGRGHFEVRSNAPRLMRLFALAVNPDEPVAEIDRSAERDQETVEMKPLKFTTPHSGLHLLEISQGKGTGLVEWNAGELVCINPAEATLWGPYSLYFYVPKGTKTVNGHVMLPGKSRVTGGNGRVVFDFRELPADTPTYFHIPVPEGEDGKFWRLGTGSRGLKLLNVPPYMGLSPQTMLLPREVVEKDAGKPE